ncbi:methyltransferase domain-containing protein [Rhizobiaceae bacterium]|nr:methyltransferase domain-containing protein [Rhizobiaceae bacterium]
MTIHCNICGSTDFASFRNRPAERCTSCDSLARHRVVAEAYSLLLSEGAEVLHLAPEPCIYPLLAKRFSEGYRTADAAPERYAHAPAESMRLPDDLGRFADGTFDAILHNHVLEHIPGHYGDWLPPFLRWLKPGGRMIFTIPGPYDLAQTKEGGENLATDAERLEHFLQEDHFRLFGREFEPWLAALEGGELEPDPVSDDRRAELGVRPGKGRVFVWRRAT